MELDGGNGTHSYVILTGRSAGIATLSFNTSQDNETQFYKYEL